MTPPVSFADLLEAYEFAGFDAAVGTHGAYIHLELGTVHWVSDEVADLPELPEDLETGPYLSVPDRHELGLGARLALDFAHAHLAPEDAQRVQGYFRRRGAYGRFKDLLERRGQLRAWHDHEQQVTERRLRQWCAQHDIALRD